MNAFPSPGKIFFDLEHIKWDKEIHQHQEMPSQADRMGRDGGSLPAKPSGVMARRGHGRGGGGGGNGGGRDHMRWQKHSVADVSVSNTIQCDWNLPRDMRGPGPSHANGTVGREASRGGGGHQIKDRAASVARHTPQSAHQTPARSRGASNRCRGALETRLWMECERSLI